MIVLLLCGFVLWKVATFVYRLYFHPLRKFPGPRLAAMTSLYTFYFNVVKGGMFVWEIDRMHRQYGPIVRITPSELHINDPDFYSTIYAGRRDKDPKHFTRLVMPTAAVSTVDHNLHASRPGLLSNFYSKKSIRMRQSIVTDHVEKLCKILEKAHETDSVVPMNHVFSSLTGDVTFNFAYGSNLGNLDKGVSTNRFYQSGKESLAFLHVLHYMPIVVLLKITPEWLVGIISPSAKPLCDLKDIIREESRQALDADVSDRKKNTVFDTLIDPSLPPEERELERLVDAGFELMTAGIDSAASTLAFTLFHLLSNEDMLAKLRYELDQNPQSTEWSDLEKLPYLSAVLSEGLRLWTNFHVRLIRSAPGEAISYKEWVIPKGALMSSSFRYLHGNPEFFPDPEEFRPERWIDVEMQQPTMKHRLVPFGKGTRQCLGQNISWAQLYTVLAALVRRFEFELFETELEDIAHHRQYGVGSPRKNNPGLRVKVAKVLQAGGK